MNAKNIFVTTLTVFLCTVNVVFAKTADYKDKYQVSFKYNGQVFNPASWSADEQLVADGVTKVSYLSPDGKLRLSVSYRQYEDYPIVEMRPVLFHTVQTSGMP